MFDITTIGEVLIDLTQTGTNENGIPIYTAFPGGAPANVAVAASRLGAKTAFIGKVGNDAYGELLLNTLNTNKVNTDGFIIDDNSNTTLAVVSVNAEGERSFVFYRNRTADTLLNENEISGDILNNTRILHFGSVSLTDEPLRTATLSAVIRAKDNGASISYDPNYRASLWSSESEAIHQMKAPLKYVDILKISDEELPLFTGTDNTEEGTRLLADEFNINLIIVTLGSNGAFFRFKELTGSVDGFKVIVADTNGAGDTFYGAFLSQMATLGKTNPDDLSETEIRQMLNFSNLAASITVSRHGAIPAMPLLDEIQI